MQKLPQKVVSSDTNGPHGRVLSIFLGRLVAYCTDPDNTWMLLPFACCSRLSEKAEMEIFSRVADLWVRGIFLFSHDGQSLSILPNASSARVLILLGWPDHQKRRTWRVSWIGVVLCSWKVMPVFPWSFSLRYY